MRGERVDVEGGGGGGKRDQPSRERGGRQGSLPAISLGAGECVDPFGPAVRR